MFGEEKANGGRIGFSGGGGAGLPAATTYGLQARIPGAGNIPMGEFEKELVLSF